MKNINIKNIRAMAHEFALDAASNAGVLAQRQCTASEEDRHEPHGRFAAHEAARAATYPAAFAAQIAHLCRYYNQRAKSQSL